MSVTTDPDDPRLGHGIDEKPVPQNEVYLVLSEQEKAKGYVRPVRTSYKHVGAPVPKYPTRELTAEEKKRFGADNWAVYEPYPESESPKAGKFWTQAELDNVGKGCGEVTTMNLLIAQTYAREPNFYGSTYCMRCGKHLPVQEFIWIADGARVGS